MTNYCRWLPRGPAAVRAATGLPREQDAGERVEPRLSPPAPDLISNDETRERCI